MTGCFGSLGALAIYPHRSPGSETQAPPHRSSVLLHGRRLTTFAQSETREQHPAKPAQPSPCGLAAALAAVRPSATAQRPARPLHGLQHPESPTPPPRLLSTSDSLRALPFLLEAESLPSHLSKSENRPSPAERSPGSSS